MANCKLCQSPVAADDYTAIPAHVVCLAPIKLKAVRTDGCTMCGKSHEESPRGALSRGGLRARCRACSNRRICNA